jgi:1-acyl-sn-glycerol-3-phosphate acyltransferase
MSDAAERDRDPASGELIVHKTWTYSFLRGLVDVVGRLYFRRRIEGREHVPSEGPVVFASNHQSFLDIPLVAQATRRHVCFVARRSLAGSRLLGWIMAQCGAVLVSRGESDRAAVRDMIGHLERGDTVAIFPEGTRTRDGRVGEFQRGALLVARRAGVPIIPIGIRGTFEAWPRGGGFPRPQRLVLRFGAPIDSSLPDAQERVRQAVLDMVGDGRYESLSEIP